MLRLYSLLDVAAHIRQSSSLAMRARGIAWISIRTLIGNIGEILSQSQPFSIAMFPILSSASPLARGPWIMDLKGPLDVQESVQNLRLLSRPRLHRVPLEKVSIPLFIAFQIRELGREFSFLELILLGVIYFFWST